MAKKGNLSINSENMLPIIKKWLYSDHDIFVREQIANANDAITKLKKLEGIGEYKREDDKPYRIDVTTNADEKTLTFKDNGIGMTEDEVVEYITQIAFSGATAFLEKYKGKSDEDQIIGLLQHQRQQLPIDDLVLHDQEQPLVVGRMKFDVAVGHFFKSFLKVNSINVI